MLSSPRTRLLAVTLLLAVLAVLIVWAGTVEPDPANNNYPGSEEIYDDPDQYIGQRVSVSGTIVDTEPLTIEDEPAPGKDVSLVIDGTTHDVSTGDELRVYGTLQSNDRIDSINTVHIEPWETRYLHVISFLAGLWVLARLVNRWTIDTTTWCVVPRTDPLLHR